MQEEEKEEFNILLLDQLKELDNIELIAYKKQLFVYGQEIEEYISVLKQNWQDVIHELQDRLMDLQFEIAYHQADHEDNVGEGNPSDFSIQ
jgi:hypothetical protein